MKIKEFNLLVQNDPILSITSISEQQRQKRAEILHPFFSNLTLERENRLILLVTKLLDTARHSTDPKQHKNIKELTDQFNLELTHASSCSLATRAKIDHLLQKHRFIAERAVHHAHMTKKTSTLAQYATPLPLLKRFALLQCEEKQLKTISHHIDLFVPPPPAKPSRKKLLDITFAPFEEQNLILSGKPRNPSQVAAYFNTCLQHDARIQVSLQDISEHNQEDTRFWQHKVLKQSVFNDGWQITNNGSRELATGKKKNQNQVYPKIIETTLVATKEGRPPRTITHLHYSGWIDSQICPDIDLLEQLLDRIDTIDTPSHPIAINCHAGMGRTGEVATCILLRRKIVRAHQQKTDLTRFQVNVPELILELRKIRQLHVCGGMLHFPQICSLTNRLYKRLLSS